MKHYAGMNVWLDSLSVCVVDGAGKLVREAKIASEPGPLAAWSRGLAAEWVLLLRLRPCLRRQP